MLGASDLIGEATYKLRIADGKHFIISEPTLETIAKIENHILERAYTNAEALPESSTKARILSRLDAKFIQNNAHKFMQEEFLNFVEENSTEFLFVLLYSASNTECSLQEFVQAIVHDQHSLVQAISFVSKAFFLTLMPREMSKYPIPEEQKAKVMQGMQNLVQVLKEFDEKATTFQEFSKPTLP